LEFGMPNRVTAPGVFEIVFRREANALENATEFPARAFPTSGSTTKALSKRCLESFVRRGRQAADRVGCTFPIAPSCAAVVGWTRYQVAIDHAGPVRLLRSIVMSDRRYELAYIACRSLKRVFCENSQNGVDDPENSMHNRWLRLKKYEVSA
jgi:hypothetical protein